MNKCILLAVAAATLLVQAPVGHAHHSVLNYDGKVTVKISGIVTRGRFGYPHSVYHIDVTNDDGEIEEWVLSTEDPRDARQLGFDDELRAIKVGDPITVVGWPDKFKERTIRGHQLHYPDGRVVMMRRGNYIWPRDILRMDKMAYNPDTIPANITSTNAALPAADKALAWIAEDDHLSRLAREIADGNARLIGLTYRGNTEFPGVDELLQCHTRRDGFTMRVDLDTLDANRVGAIDDGSDYITNFNRVLSRWWEQEKESCE